MQLELYKLRPMGTATLSCDLKIIEIYLTLNAEGHCPMKYAPQKFLEKEFVELRDLAIGMNYLNMDGKLISSLPYIKDSSFIFRGVKTDDLQFGL